MEIVFISVVVVLVVFLVGREGVCWYYKINSLERKLEQCVNCLELMVHGKAMIAEPSTRKHLQRLAATEKSEPAQDLNAAATVACPACSEPVQMPENVLKLSCPRCATVIEVDG